MIIVFGPRFRKGDAVLQADIGDESVVSGFNRRRLVGGETVMNGVSDDCSIYWFTGRGLPIYDWSPATPMEINVIILALRFGSAEGH